MKTIISYILIFLLFSEVSICQHNEPRFNTEELQFIIGNWTGTINAGVMKFTFVFKFWIDDDKILKGTLDSPEQDLKDIPVNEIIIKEDSLKLDIRPIQRKYYAVMNKNDKVINGLYIRNGQINFPLLLNKVESEVILKRPQMPKKPYPYKEEEISFINENDGTRLAGTLTVPDGKAPFPAVILMSGSGAQDRDESEFGHKTFLVIADYLTRSGVAVLRFDDRGVGGSSGDHLQATSKTNSEDIIYATGFIRSRKDINKRKVGLIGHSEGGLIASIVASKCPQIAYIILLGAPGQSIEENLYKQNEMIRMAEGESANMISQYNSLQKQIFSIIKEEANDSVAAEKLRSAYTMNSYHLLSPEQKKNIDARINDLLLTPYFRDIIKCDPSPFLQKVKCPVLAITGEKDLQASPTKNLAAMDEAFKSGGNKNYKLIELPGINHMMQTCKKGTISEYSDIEETISPLVLNTISEWILTNTK
jgi:pimeloyl-ACP methyl ester carboxylesterase